MACKEWGTKTSLNVFKSVYSRYTGMTENYSLKYFTLEPVFETPTRFYLMSHCFNVL